VADSKLERAPMRKPRKRKRRSGPQLAEARSEWAFRADEAAVLRSLVTGAHAPALREYFGDTAYGELRRLAKSGKTPRSDAARVLIIPGIMGSRLGRPTLEDRSRRVVWIDPVSIGRGEIRALQLPGGQDLRPMGVLLHAYARLQLSLHAAGIAAQLHAYDWRLGLDELGSALAERIRADNRPVVLVGHSMGGMVARMAAALLPRRLVRKLVLIGTPNFGSYAPVQAFRGTYPFVRRVTLLDPVHTPEVLAAEVFKTFPGLYQLLPPRERLRGANLYRRSGWPKLGPQPDLAQLGRVAAVRAALAPPDARMVQILGVDRSTIIATRCRTAGFDYEMSLAGDGTVPVELAVLPDVPSYFVAEWHADLANHPAVIAAVLDLVRRGRTQALRKDWRPPQSSPTHIDDAALAAGDGPKIDWRRLDPPARAATLAALSR
jgi:pimeloyl-ACP methyl ester carboxylesterase